MRRRLGLLLISTALVACAGITGLGDYSIDDGTPDAAVAETGTRADGTTTVATTEGGTTDVSVPSDGTAPNDVNPPPPDCSATPCDVIVSSDVADVTVSDTALYWLDSKLKTVRTASLDGSSARDLITGEDASHDLRALAASNGYLGWFSGTQVRRAPIGGGAASNVVMTYPGPNFSSVACMKKSASTNNVHFIVPGAVYKVDLAAGNSVPDVPILPSYTGGGVVGNGTDLFFTATNGVYQRMTNGSTTPAKLVDNQSDPECIELADGLLFWANHGSGELVRSTLDGKTHSAIATGQSGIHGVSTNKTHVYWSHAGGIRRLER